MTSSPSPGGASTPLETPWTAGPWSQKKHGSRVRIVDAQEITVAHVPVGYNTNHWPDARLIAAAPDQVEAAALIKQTATPAENDTYVISGAAYRLTCTALALARGGSQ